MAKITDLVKTYRMLSDPNAPDWNVKFIGGIAVLAIVVAAGAGALLWSVSHDNTPAATTSASVQDTPSEEDPCKLPADAPAGAPLPTECLDPSPAVLP